MKKLLHILLFCGMLSGAFAQNSNCGSISPEIEPTQDAIELCEGMPTEELPISVSSNLPDTEFFVVNMDQPVDDDLGDNIIVGISDDGIFIPETLGFTHDEQFAVLPFSCNIEEFRYLVDAILNNTSAGVPCCDIEQNNTPFKNFCDNLSEVEIYSSEDINTLNDIWNVLIASAGNAGNNFSINSFISQINTLKVLVDGLPEDCRYSSDYCYALGNNEQLFRILETPTIEVITDVPYEITISSTISDGILEYSIDEESWQMDNIIQDVPTQGVAYVREVLSQCVEARSYVNSNLPISLREFKGTNETTTNLLYWVTETEINGAGFGIERSSDGENFTKIDWVDGAGNSQIAVEYVYRDMSPLTGTSYYRLAMEDIDGRVEYSPITSVERKDGRGFGIISVGPNPSANIINISILNEEIGPVQYLIYDVMGRKVREGTQDLAIGINNFPIDAAMMGTGMYVFTAFKGDYVVSAYKFVMH